MLTQGDGAVGGGKGLLKFLAAVAGKAVPGQPHSSGLRVRHSVQQRRVFTHQPVHHVDLASVVVDERPFIEQFEKIATVLLGLGLGQENVVGGTD